MGKLLRTTRIIIATFVFIIATCGFLKMSGGNIVSEALLKIQFTPALMSMLGGTFGAFVFLLAITLLFGRVYCSFLCPLGIFQDIIIRITNIARKKANKGKLPLNKYSKPHNILRYTILGITALCLVAGLTYPLALLDPYSNYGRIAVQVFSSVENGITNMLSGIFPSMFYTQAYVTVGLYSFIFALVFLFVIIVFSAAKGRLYCNTVCPVGSFLGLLSGVSLFKPQINKEMCVKCGLCAGKCKSNCINLETKEIDTTRCVACYDCMISCKRGGVKLVPTWFKKTSSKQSDNTPDSDRRNALIAMGGLAAAVAAKKIIPAKQTSENGNAPILPPGAGNMEAFKNACTACHACIAACPNNILRPATFEYGFDGIMLPTIRYDKKYCSFGCNKCSEVCPNDAIAPLTLEQKRKTQIGLAVYDASKCVVVSDGIHCGACAGNCPVGAIQMVENPVVPGQLLPKVDPLKCIGCGACEYACPGMPKAIVVKGKAVQTEI
ncbi:MAG: 4Fe-4S binding protein [Bacteroidales bacterium]|nr:4Fe-4S binding protein [Bacteroidales bacterium]